MYRKALVLTWTLGFALPLCAQIFPSQGSNRNSGFPSSGGMPGQGTGASTYNSGSGGGSTFNNNNSSAVDSTQIKIPREVYVLDPQALFRHQVHRKPLAQRFQTLPLWDALDAVAFSQNLGQIGKYYQVFSDGLNEKYFDQPFWRDPVLARYDRYMHDPRRQTLWIDTRTPYVNVSYTQGPHKLQLVDVSVSQNITPLWNALIYFKRRQMVGVYRDMTTDHTEVYGSGNYHSENERYHAFFQVGYNRLRDELNGGVPRPSDPIYEDGEGLLREVGSLYNNSFFKGNSAPMLSGAQNERWNHSIYTDHYYHLLGRPDSADVPFRLSLRGTFSAGQGGLRFQDEGISLSRLEANLIPVYPALEPDSTYIIDGWKTPQWKASGETSITLALRNNLSLNVRGGLGFEQINLRKDTTIASQEIFSQHAEGDLVLGPLRARARLQQNISSLLPVEQTFLLGANVDLMGKTPAYRVKVGKDSLPPVTKSGSEPQRRVPLTLDGSFDFRNLNPSLFQRYFAGDSGYAFRPNPDLGNQRITRLAAELRYDFASHIRKGDTLLPGFVSLRAFLTQADRLIIYNQRMEAVQAEPGEGITYFGAELSGNRRLFNHFYAETRNTFQIANGGTDSLMQLVAKSVPGISGKTSLYYENDQVTFAERMRIGVDVSYFTSYVGQAPDPVSGEFFQSNYVVIPYTRVDAYVTLKLRGVLIFARVVHANEQLLLSGYYTTPFYPMLERSVTFGVNWSFFD